MASRARGSARARDAIEGATATGAARRAPAGVAAGRALAARIGRGQRAARRQRRRLHRLGVGAAIARDAIGLEARLVQDGRALGIIGAGESRLAVFLVHRQLAQVAHVPQLVAGIGVARGGEVAAGDRGGGREGGRDEGAIQANHGVSSSTARPPRTSCIARPVVPTSGGMVDPIAVVTGANRGLGAEIARQLGGRGVRVVRTSRERLPGFELLDVTRPEQAAALAARLGTVDILVNNAGVSLDGFDADVASRTLDVNFHGALQVTDALLPRMRVGGRIVMISSGMGSLSAVHGPLRQRLLDPGLTREELLKFASSFVLDVSSGTHAMHGWPSNAYSVSKILLNAAVRVLAAELADDPRRILVNAESPGWVRTRMGGRSAPSTVEEGARTAVWLALLPEGGPTGGFFADEKPMAW
jgi:NAD(P)-dependent dehydrogenase (short-subunit alcohol dehydrogenase family)